MMKDMIAQAGVDAPATAFTPHEEALVTVQGAVHAVAQARGTLDVLRARYRAAVERADGAEMWRIRTALGEGREYLAAAEVALARARVDAALAAVDEATTALAVHQQAGNDARQTLVGIAREVVGTPASPTATTMDPERLQHRSAAQAARQHAQGREMIASLQQTEAGRHRVIAETELKALIDATCKGIA